MHVFAWLSNRKHCINVGSICFVCSLRYLQVTALPFKHFVSLKHLCKQLDCAWSESANLCQGVLTWTRSDLGFKSSPSGCLPDQCLFSGSSAAEGFLKPFYSAAHWPKLRKDASVCIWNTELMKKDNQWNRAHIAHIMYVCMQVVLNVFTLNNENAVTSALM